MPSIESALVVLVPEADALVKPFRDRYDPSAAVGVPAHITLLPGSASAAKKPASWAIADAVAAAETSAEASSNRKGAPLKPGFLEP